MQNFTKQAILAAQAENIATFIDEHGDNVLCIDFTEYDAIAGKFAGLEHGTHDVLNDVTAVVIGKNGIVEVEKCVAETLDSVDGWSKTAINAVVTTKAGKELRFEFGIVKHNGEVLIGEHCDDDFNIEKLAQVEDADVAEVVAHINAI